MLLDYDNLVKKYKMNVTGVIHIGGHHGSEYDIYNQYDSIQHMLFFEPDEDSYKVLVNKVGGDDRAICINKALGPFKGKTSFFRSKDNSGQSNSLMKPDLHARQYPHIVFTEEIEIKPSKQTVPPVVKKSKKRSTMLYEQKTYVKNRAKWDAAEKWAKKKGVEFKILTEKELGI